MEKVCAYLYASYRIRISETTVGTIQLFELCCNMFMLDSNLAHFNVPSNGPSIHITFFVFYYLISTSKLLCSK